MMNIGLLWYDDDPKKTLERKIGDAVARYQERFGALPNACHVHGEGTEARRQATVGERQLALVPNRAIRAHHYWVGAEQET